MPNHLSPLRALVEGRQQLVDGLRRHLDEGAAGQGGLVDLGEGGHGVGDHLGFSHTKKRKETKIDFKKLIIERAGLVDCFNC